MGFISPELIAKIKADEAKAAADAAAKNAAAQAAADAQAQAAYDAARAQAQAAADAQAQAAHDAARAQAQAEADAKAQAAYDAPDAVAARARAAGGGGVNALLRIRNKVGSSQMGEMGGDAMLFEAPPINGLIGKQMTRGSEFGYQRRKEF